LFKLALNIYFDKYGLEIRQHHQNQSCTGLVFPANKKHKKPGTPPFRPTAPKSGIRTRFGSALSKVVLSRRPGWYRIVASDGNFLGSDDKEGANGWKSKNSGTSKWMVYIMENPIKMG